jgi:hypothetical protein
VVRLDAPYIDLALTTCHFFFFWGMSPFWRSSTTVASRVASCFSMMCSIRDSGTDRRRSRSGNPFPFFRRLLGVCQVQTGHQFAEPLLIDLVSIVVVPLDDVLLVCGEYSRSAITHAFRWNVRRRAVRVEFLLIGQSDGFSPLGVSKVFHVSRLFATLAANDLPGLQKSEPVHARLCGNGNDRAAAFSYNSTISQRATSTTGFSVCQAR